MGNFNWEITAKKFFTGLLYAGIPFVLTYAIGFLETEEFPLEYAGCIVIATGVLHLLANYFKHRKD